MLHISYDLVRLLQSWVWRWYRMLITGVQATFYMGDLCCQLLLVFSVEGIRFLLSLGTLMHGLGHFVSSYPCSEKKGQDTGSYEPAWVWGQERCKVCNQTITVSLLQPLQHLLLPVGQLNYLKQNSAMSELNSLQHKTCFLSQDNKTPLELL